MSRIGSTSRTAGLTRAAVVAATLVGAIIAQEFAVRLALPAYDPAGHVRFIEETETTPQRGPAGVARRLIKNTGEFDVAIRFNRHGMRDAKDFANSGPDDLFMVGDSYAFGWGVEENQRVSERLQARLGRPVFNLSSGGGDIDNYAMLLDYAVERGATIGKAVIAFNMATDLRIYGAPRRPAKPAPPPTPAARMQIVKGYLMRHSALYFMTSSVVHNSSTLTRIAVAAGLMVPTGRAKPSKGADPRVLDSSARRLAALFARYPGIALVIPSPEISSAAEGAATRRIHGDFVARLRALGIDTLDLLPAFERGGDPGALHFRTDAHWNAAGHDLAAQALADRLRRGAD